jgi:hypothetical protein
VQAQDVLKWRGTTNGEFSVRNAYHMEKELQDTRRSGNSRQRDENKLWKMLWRLKAPNVVKMFMWRACHDTLPTKQNLLRRGVVSDAFCMIFEHEEETIQHILWNCPLAQDVWGYGPKQFQKCTSEGSSFATLVKTLMGRCEVADIEIMTVVARKIWLRRNGVVVGNEFTHPQKVILEARQSIGDFRRAMHTEMKLRSTTHEVSPYSWQPPLTKKSIRLTGMWQWIKIMDTLDWALLSRIMKALS